MGLELGRWRSTVAGVKRAWGGGGMVMVRMGEWFVSMILFLPTSVSF
jgi:hypothetical protein